MLRTSLRRKKVTAICRYIQKWVAHRSFKFWVFSGNLWPEINCRAALIKVSLEPVSFVSTAGKFVTNCWRTGQPSLTTLTMNRFAKNSKHGFNSWKWSKQAWNSSTSLFIVIFFYFVVLQLPLREKHAFSFWHWENDRMLLTICVYEKFQFSFGSLSSL